LSAEHALEGKVALVTGSSRGIGRAIVESLACHGADVAINYRERADLAAEAVQAVEGEGRRAVAVQADVGRPDEALRLFDRTVESLGGLDILVNNAGLWQGSRIEDVEPELLLRTMATNLMSAFYLSGPSVDLMKIKDWGRVINISSVIGVTGYPGDTVYGATKAGLIGLTKSLARELARTNITVNAIIPGFIETDMASQTGPETRERILKTIPMRRYGLPREVAELATFLCIGGDYITGQLFTVDGGYTI
jgi:NAD(P)-dependent dehydrogenase (short-subunit alcohol dehydrogenase family)